jgi:phosphinothricin acetyltransferase
MDVAIRPAVRADLERVNEIYNGYIIDSHVSFDLEPWSLDRREAWWMRYADDVGPYRVLVAEVDGRVVGAAYSSPYRPKAAYRTSVETTVVIDPALVRRGLGRRLLTFLIDLLREAGAHRAYAVVALPNEASIRLHEALGYRRVGTFDEVGHKLGRYWSTMILEKRITQMDA